MCENVLLLIALKHCEVYFMPLIFVICCSSKNSCKSLVSWFSVFWQFLWQHVLWGWDFTDWRQSMLMLLPACICLIVLLSYICWICHPSPSGYLSSPWFCNRELGGFRFPLKRGFFLTGNGHAIIIWTFTYVSFGFNKLKQGLIACRMLG